MKTAQLSLFDAPASPKHKKQRKQQVKSATENDIAIAEKPKVELPPIELPSAKFDIIEQFALALQNRDAIGMKQMLAEKLDGLAFKTPDEFISKFTGYCDKMEKKHKGIFVQTVPGKCGLYKECLFGKRGLGVSVSTIKGNKLLWRFNLIFHIPYNGFRLDMRRCANFVVQHEEVPY